MRHIAANLAVYLIALLLAGGAAAFGFTRSRQLVVVSEQALLTLHDPAAVREFEWAELGAAGYERNCSACHLADGSGWDQYQALRVAAQLAAAPGGRDYLVDLHLRGLATERWRAPMPRMNHLTDVELAAILNHVVSRFGGGAARAVRPFVPQEVAARRGRDGGPISEGAAPPAAGRAGNRLPR